MHSITVVILKSLLIQVSTKVLEVNRSMVAEGFLDKLMDTLVDKLIDRTSSIQRNQADLEKTTLGKAGRSVMLGNQPMASRGAMHVAASPLALKRDVRAWGEKDYQVGGYKLSDYGPKTYAEPDWEPGEEPDWWKVKEPEPRSWDPNFKGSKYGKWPVDRVRNGYTNFHPMHPEGNFGEPDPNGPYGFSDVPQYIKVLLDAGLAGKELGDEIRKRSPYESINARDEALFGNFSTELDAIQDWFPAPPPSMEYQLAREKKMLAFIADKEQQAKEAKRWPDAEILNGRWAMMGFAGALAQEFVSDKSALENGQTFLYDLYTLINPFESFR